jgi:serine protease Do
MRLAIGAIALLCGMALPGEPNRFASRAHAHATDPCGWIGVAVRPITSAFATSLGMVEPYGAIFEQPDPGGPAARAGIQAGDVITAVNGTHVEKAADFAGMIAELAPESIVHLQTYRDGQVIERQITLGSGKCPPARQH